MLSVPKAIDDLLHQDTCQKNIRIHFPNGERSDICNDMIVLNSVAFTESFCSHDTLKLGLCESPVFECEVVGVGNVKGATIQVFCEIFCDSSVSGAVFQPDLSAYVYQIPYGVFVIETCQREADMTHRKIVAYGIDFNYVLNSPYEKLREKKPVASATTYTHDLIKILLSDIGDKYISSTVVRTNVNKYDPVDPGIGDPIPIVLFQTAYHQDYNFKRYQIQFWNFYWVPRIEDSTALHQLKASKVKPRDEILALIKGSTFYYRLTRQVSADLAKVLIPELCDIVNKYYDEGWFRILWSAFTISAQSTETRSVPTSADLFYPKMGSDICYLCTIFNMQITLRDSDGNTTSLLDVNSAYTDDVKYEKLEDSALPSIMINETTRKSGLFWYITGFFDDNFIEKLNATIENSGNFLRLNRYQEIEFINIKRRFGRLPSETLYPATSVKPKGATGGKLLPEDYQSCWYVDDYTIPFGLIECKYVNTSNQECIYNHYLTGFDVDSAASTYRVYTLDNSVIKSTTWTEAQIQSICEAIAANIEGVQYMPVQFVGRGLPYVEAGDTFEILTKSNDSITTIVLNRTLSGEQMLTDSYQSV